MDESIERGDKDEAISDNLLENDNTNKSNTVTQRYERQGMTLGQKSDIGVCVSMICFVVLSVLITALKIILIDMNSDKYANLFGYNASIAYFKYRVNSETNN